MRIVTGEFRGRVLKTLDGLDTRPTAGLVKEAIFSIIQFEIEDKKVLDLFSGSGQLGLEAISRGARYAVMVDKAPAAVKIIKENVANLGAGDRVAVIQRDYETYLKSLCEKFDIVILDPPYASDYIENALTLLEGKVTDGGRILCETDKDKKLPEQVGSFMLKKVYRYGKIYLYKYVCNKEQDEIK